MTATAGIVIIVVVAVVLWGFFYTTKAEEEHIQEKIRGGKREKKTRERIPGGD